MLTLGWSDGNSFVPINHCLLSAADDKNLLCEAKHYDGGSLSGKRRIRSRCKATDIMVELLRSAQTAGISAKYVLQDQIWIQWRVSEHQGNLMSTFLIGHTITKSRQENRQEQ